eukprot:4350392-Prymnesium_polylepis.1
MRRNVPARAVHYRQLASDPPRPAPRLLRPRATRPSKAVSRQSKRAHTMSAPLLNCVIDCRHSDTARDNCSRVKRSSRARCVSVTAH